MVLLVLLNIVLPIVTFQESNCISITIKKDPKLKGKDSIELDFNVNNCSKHNLILYNLKEAIETNQFEDDFYCSSEITAGITLFIYDANSEMMWPDLSSDNSDYPPMTEERVVNLASQVRHKFRKNSAIIAAGQNNEIKKTVDLKRSRSFNSWPYPFYRPKSSFCESPLASLIFLMNSV